jgi:hypothetical protein
MHSKNVSSVATGTLLAEKSDRNKLKRHVTTSTQFRQEFSTEILLQLHHFTFTVLVFDGLFVLFFEIYSYYPGNALLRFI